MQFQFFSNRSVLAHDLVRRFFQATNLNHLFLQWPLPSFLTRLHTRVAAKGTFLWLHLRKEREETRPTGNFFVTRLSVKITDLHTKGFFLSLNASIPANCTALYLEWMKRETKQAEWKGMRLSVCLCLCFSAMAVFFSSNLPPTS